MGFGDVRSLVIVAEPRSGSNLLVDALREVPGLGRVEEWFDEFYLHDRLVACRAADHTSTPGAPRATCGSRAVEQLLSTYRGTGWFGVKLHRHQFLAAERANLGDVLEHLESLTGPPTVVMLTRRDKVRQAVSTFLAVHTGIWVQRADGTQERSTSPVRRYWDSTNPSLQTAGRTVPEFDYDEVRLILEDIIDSESWWQRQFAVRHWAAHQLTYEDLVDARVKTLDGFFLALGFADLQAPSPTLRRQSTAVNDAYVARFLQHATM